MTKKVEVPVEVVKEVEKIVEVEKRVYVEKNLTEGTVCSCKPGFYSTDAGALVAFFNDVRIVLYLCRCCDDEATHSVNQTLPTENFVQSHVTLGVLASCLCRRRRSVQQVPPGQLLPGGHPYCTLPRRCQVGSRYALLPSRVDVGVLWILVIDLCHHSTLAFALVTQTCSASSTRTRT